MQISLGVSRSGSDSHGRSATELVEEWFGTWTGTQGSEKG